MQLFFNRVDGAIVLRFATGETAMASLRMECLVGKMKETGEIVPSFPEGFFERLSDSDKSVEIKFSSNGLSFVIGFLEEMLIYEDEFSKYAEALKVAIFEANERPSNSNTIH